MTKTEKEIEDMDFFDKVQDAFDLDDRMTDYIRQMYADRAIRDTTKVGWDGEEIYWDRDQEIWAIAEEMDRLAKNRPYLKAIQNIVDLYIEKLTKINEINEKAWERDLLGLEGMS